MSRMLSWTLSSGQRAGVCGKSRCAILGFRVTVLEAVLERVLIEGRGNLGI